jgi:hypothetical protein
MTKIDKVFVAVQYAKRHYNGVIVLNYLFKQNIY